MYPLSHCTGHQGIYFYSINIILIALSLFMHIQELSPGKKKIIEEQLQEQHTDVFKPKLTEHLPHPEDAPFQLQLNLSSN